MKMLPALRTKPIKTTHRVRQGSSAFHAVVGSKTTSLKGHIDHPSRLFKNTTSHYSERHGFFVIPVDIEIHSFLSHPVLDPDNILLTYPQSSTWNMIRLGGFYNFFIYAVRFIHNLHHLPIRSFKCFCNIFRLSFYALQ